KVFFINYEKCLKDVEELADIPRGTVIRYGESKTVFLEIQKYIFKGNEDDREIIRQHLVTIAATIDPSEKKLKALENSAPVLEKMGLNDGSCEGQFVSAIMRKAKKSMEETNTDDPS